MSTPTPFTRDRFTWLAYLALAYFAYVQATLGPLMPFLRDELRMSYTVSGLHLSAFAAGQVVAGAASDPLARRWGRRGIFWLGGGGMALAALLFTVGHRPALTIGSALLLGLPGGLLLAMIQSSLSARHGEQRAVALTESNIAASIAAGLAPLAVGSFERVGIGWRGALVAGALAWVVLGALYHAAPFPARGAAPAVQATSSRRPRLPAAYWVLWSVVFLCVSVEWSIVFWGTDFLEKNVGLSKVNASTLMTVFFAAAVIGRTGGSRLARRIPLDRLLPGAMAIALAGFVPFWLAPVAPLNIAGLFVAGLGIGNLFPLTLSAASGAVEPHQADAASGWLALAAGLSILILPQVLGTLADLTSIKAAFGMVAAFLALAAVAVVLARPSLARAGDPSPANPAEHN